MADIKQVRFSFWVSLTRLTDFVHNLYLILNTNRPKETCSKSQSPKLRNDVLVFIRVFFISFGTYTVASVSY